MLKTVYFIDTEYFYWVYYIDTKPFLDDMMNINTGSKP